MSDIIRGIDIGLAGECGCSYDHMFHDQTADSGLFCSTWSLKSGKNCWAFEAFYKNGNIFLRCAEWHGEYKISDDKKFKCELCDPDLIEKVKEFIRKTNE